MRTITIDFETYWDAQHSLTKLSPAKYIMHPDTEIQSAAIKVDAGETVVLFGDEIQAWVDETNFDDAMLVGHNMAGFDAGILAWRYQVKPKAWACTLAMARQIGAAQSAGGSLAALARQFGLGEKLSLDATNTKGKRLADFTAGEITAMREYNKVDTDLCYGLFKRMLPDVGLRSMRLIDMTIRMMTEPRFHVDRGLLEQTLVDLERRQQEMLLSVGRDMALFAEASDDEIIEAARKTLASAPKFAKFLASRGVEVPMKISGRTGKEIPALAKTDEGMLALVEHDDPEIAAAAAARLGVKSTQLGTRTQSFLDTAALFRDRMPVFLTYAGAGKTLRWSGFGGLNHQNLPRIGKKPKPADALRKCLKAPPGHKVVVADLSGIELRMMHFLWGVGYSTELYRQDPKDTDLYVNFAAKLYKKPEGDVTKEERQIGKVAHLQLQYGSGAKKFVDMAKLMGGVTITQEESNDVVAVYRAEHPEIVRGWRIMSTAMQQMHSGQTGMALDPHGLCRVIENGIQTPRGRLHYPGLTCERNDETGYMEWHYMERSPRSRRVEPVRMYGAKMAQNLTQNLAREAMADMMLEINKHYPIVHTVHDEVILIVPEDEADEALAYMQTVMRAGVRWFPELVTWSDGDIADTYGDAK